MLLIEKNLDFVIGLQIGGHIGEQGGIGRNDVNNVLRCVDRVDLGLEIGVSACPRCRFGLVASRPCGFLIIQFGVQSHDTAFGCGHPSLQRGDVGLALGNPVAIDLHLGDSCLMVVKFGFYGG